MHLALEGSKDLESSPWEDKAAQSWKHAGKFPTAQRKPGGSGDGGPANDAGGGAGDGAGGGQPSRLGRGPGGSASRGGTVPGSAKTRRVGRSGRSRTGAAGSRRAAAGSSSVESVAPGSGACDCSYPAEALQLGDSHCSPEKVAADFQMCDVLRPLGRGVLGTVVLARYVLFHYCVLGQILSASCAERYWHALGW